MGFHFLLQGIFLTGATLRLLLGGGSFMPSRRPASCFGSMESQPLDSQGSPSLHNLKSLSLISLQSKGLSRVFSNTTVQKHHFREWDVAF